MTSPLPLPPGGFEAYIFDLDGTLVDSMPLHMAAWNRVIRAHGGQFQLDPQAFMQVAGVGGFHTVEFFNRTYGSDMKAGDVVHEKEIYYRELIATRGLPILEPVTHHARQAAARGIRCAVASGGPREIVHHVLQLTGLEPLFQAIVTQCDVVRSKPAPDIFLEAAKRLGLPPARCLVFEDSHLGIEGAEAAGMASLLVPLWWIERWQA